MWYDLHPQHWPFRVAGRTCPWWWINVIVSWVPKTASHVQVQWFTRRRTQCRIIRLCQVYHTPERCKAAEGKGMWNEVQRKQQISKCPLQQSHACSCSKELGLHSWSATLVDLIGDSVPWVSAGGWSGAPHPWHTTIPELHGYQGIRHQPLSTQPFWMLQTLCISKGMGDTPKSQFPGASPGPTWEAASLRRQWSRLLTLFCMVSYILLGEAVVFGLMIYEFKI